MSCRVADTVARNASGRDDKLSAALAVHAIAVLQRPHHRPLQTCRQLFVRPWIRDAPQLPSEVHRLPIGRVSRRACTRVDAAPTACNDTLNKFVSQPLLAYPQDPREVSCAAAFNHSETARVVDRDGLGWHHLAVTWTAANNGLTQIYLDGAQQELQPTRSCVIANAASQKVCSAQDVTHCRRAQTKITNTSGYATASLAMGTGSGIQFSRLSISTRRMPAHRASRVALPGLQGCWRPRRSPGRRSRCNPAAP